MRAEPFLLACLLAAPARAQDDASFARSLAEARAAAPTVQTADDIAARKARERFSRLIASKLSWYGRAELPPGIDAARLSHAVVQGLRAGDYDSVVLGESHSNPQEVEAAETLIGAILESGLPVGAFLQEAADVVAGDGKKGEPVGIFKNLRPLAAAKVPNLLMKSQFAPDPDVEAGLAAAGKRLLITYSGSAHTSERARDLLIKTLKIRDLGWGAVVPGRPVIEQSLKRKRRKPVIIAMMEEAQILGAVESAVLEEASDGAPLARWQADLAAAREALEQAVAPFAPGSEIRFVQVPEQPGFYIGIAPGDRRPHVLTAALKASRSPELARWLGSRKVKRVSVWPTAVACAPEGATCAGHEVTVDSGGKDAFKTPVPLERLETGD